MAKARPANSNTHISRPGGDDRGPTTAANSKTRCGNADTDFLHRFSFWWSTRYFGLGTWCLVRPWSSVHGPRPAASAPGLRTASSPRGADRPCHTGMMTLPQLGHQPLHVDTLGEEARGAGFLDWMLALRPRLHRQPEDHDGRRLRAQATRGLDPVHLRHRDIHQDDVGLDRARLGDRVESVGR